MNTLEKVRAMTTALLLMGTLFFVVAMGQISIWSLDRNPPFEVLQYTATSAEPGGSVLVVGKVRRDIDRRCSVAYSRFLFDGVNARFELTDGVQIMNAHAIAELNRRSPDGLVVSIRIPPEAAPGKGSVMTILDYSCNPMHLFYPISVVLMFDIDILPPKN